jgi:hypothetical protein
MTEIPTASLWCGLGYALLVAGACFVIGFKMGAAHQNQVTEEEMSRLRSLLPVRDAKGKFIKRCGND